MHFGQKMDLPQSIRVVVPARLQKLRVCPMIAQSSPVSVMEYGMCEVKIATLRLFLLLRRTVSPPDCFHLSPSLCSSSRRSAASLSDNSPSSMLPNSRFTSRCFQWHLQVVSLQNGYSNGCK